jgi:hypothetical protein
MSPVFVCGVIRKFTNELGTFPQSLVPLTGPELKSRLATLVAKYSYEHFISGYDAWCKLHILDAQEWLRHVQSDVAAASRIKRDCSVVLNSSSSTQVTPGSELPKRSKVNDSGTSSTAGGAKTSSKPKGKKTAGTSSKVVQVAAGSPPNLPPLPTGPVGKSCKFNLKHLFLGEPECTKGVDCRMHHQRTVKSCIKADLLAFLAHKCSDDSQYSELCQAVQAMA